MRRLGWKRKIGFAVLGLALLLGAVIGTYFWQIRMQKPYEVNMGGSHHMEEGAAHDHGSVQASAANQVMPGGRSCAAITEDAGNEAVREFRLTAAQTVKELENGTTEQVWAFNGSIPGPEIRVTEGERVRVILDNKDIREGVTVHWHGIVLPCSQDGVAGVTQDAVNPGEQFTYEFIADSPGTYWYHSHQASSEQVKKGLLGPLIVEPKEEAFDYDREMTLLIQELNGVYRMNGSARVLPVEAAPGETLRLRMIQAANETETFSVNGASYRILAMDGHDLNAPGVLDHHKFRMGAGQRYDLLLQMPQNGKVVIASESGLQVILGTGSDPVIRSDHALFTWTDYGVPDPGAPVADLPVDHSHTLTLDQNLFINSINGKSFHEIPPIIVNEGDRVKLTITNIGGGDHPFHLHGHRFQVLSRNGMPLSGSPVYLDTLLTQQDETFEIYVKADNPGLWMMHCHNLMHASMGMSMMLNYEGVTTPYRVGTKSGNLPDL
ncbi:Multicopper oxidase [Paenibacillus mucilaginosus 3016]|uniref:Multicopper oxidase n=1 Tax=Paenibacillus mucilaginosus 3016 TaxID=1116391 RepID=H6NFD5_9BACL|nr:multicopper oxidase family protein [Paenibacillus mucilaginosus]AFC29544.1 Multicopper oxidase [Paenibacillus mucilaginosus 3016]WFA18237.1 multicopper oxidase family protein [Paenibacillus mucilaginosus]